MKKRYCNLCESGIFELCLESARQQNGVCFGPYDLCDKCVKLVRTAICKTCNGAGNKRVRDDEASFAQASCGENRTQYKTVPCDKCK